jgi:hypothetical protein
MARRRRREPEAEQPGGDIPDWFWDRPDARQWLREHGTSDGLHAARTEWARRRQDWARQHGLIVVGLVSYQEYKRIEREEPHRIPRRRVGDGAA